MYSSIIQMSNKVVYTLTEEGIIDAISQERKGENHKDVSMEISIFLLKNYKHASEI